MRLTTRPILMGFMLITALIITPGCKGRGGGGASTGPNSDAPVQLDLQIRPLTPERTGITVRYLVTVTLMDRNNDVAGGRSVMRNVTTGQPVGEFTLTAADLLGDCVTRCTFQGGLTRVNPPPGRTDFAQTVIDAAGNRSAEISFFVNTAQAELPRGAIPSEPSIEWKPAR